MAKKEEKGTGKRDRSTEARKPSAGKKGQGYVPNEDGAKPVQSDEVSTEQLDSIISLFGDEEPDAELGTSRSDDKTRTAADDDTEDGAELMA